MDAHRLMRLDLLSQIIGDDLFRTMGWLEAKCELPDLSGRLSRGEVGAFLITGTDAALILSVAIARDSGRRGLWVEALGGSVGGSPKKNKTLIGSVLKDCEVLARASECTEIRIETSTRSALKLRLFTTFGFEPVVAADVRVMRKVIEHG